MERQKISMTINSLKNLLDQQKTLTIERLLGHNYLYNSESTDGHSKSLPIDKEKFMEVGHKAPYPPEYITLDKYLPNI